MFKIIRISLDIGELSGDNHHQQVHLTLVRQDERAALKHHLAGEVVLHDGGSEADAGAAATRGVLRAGVLIRFFEYIIDLIIIIS